MATTSDYLKLHFIVFLWGSTAIFGKLISIPSVEMVFFRTLMSTAGMIVLVLVMKEQFRLSVPDFLKIFLTGSMVGIHWLTFFGSGQVSTASVSLVGFATGSLWTAILEPLVNKKKIKALEIGLGFLVLIGLYIIFSFEFKYYLGMALGIFSGLTMAVFSVINAQFVKRIPAVTITLYEMAGAFVTTVLFLPFYKNYWASNQELNFNASVNDWLYISILALVCTVFAYSLGVNLMKRLSVFIIQLTLNLEPVYGILMAILILGETKYLSPSFYAGTAVILSAVVIYPVIKRKLEASHNSVVPDQ